MDSSDDSFAYCSASSISGYSVDEVMAVGIVNGSIHLEESEKSFKKKMQKQLFNEPPLKMKREFSEDSADEAYLALHVKKECADMARTKRHKKKDTSVLDCDVKQEMLDSDSCNNSKKPKPTKNEAMTIEENDNVEDKFTEETVIEMKHQYPDNKDLQKKSKNRVTLKSKEFVSEDESSSGESDVKNSQRTTSAPTRTRRGSSSSGESDVKRRRASNNGESDVKSRRGSRSSGECDVKSSHRTSSAPTRTRRDSNSDGESDVKSRRGSSSSGESDIKSSQRTSSAPTRTRRGSNSGGKSDVKSRRGSSSSGESDVKSRRNSSSGGESDVKSRRGSNSGGESDVKSSSSGESDVKSSQRTSSAPTRTRRGSNSGGKSDVKSRRGSSSSGESDVKSRRNSSSGGESDVKSRRGSNSGGESDVKSSSSGESDVKSSQRTSSAPPRTRRGSSTTQHRKHGSENNDGNTSAKGSQHQQATKLSDKIRFEDEAAPLEKSERAKISNQSSQFRHFLEMNPNLKPILPRLDCNAGVTKDDDVWLLKCPKDLDIAALKDSDLVLDTKCKIKINGQTYNGIIAESSTITVLSFDHNKCSILNVPLRGTINLRKRIPKVHYIDDNVMVNNQTNCIRLPDTKCRHPLFGAHYKKAMKIPAAVKARLRAGAAERPDGSRGAAAGAADSCDKHKEKKKKHTTLRDDSLEPQPAERRKRRREHAAREERHAKAKRNKRDPDSLKAWESEKAIEENLFNF